MTMQKTSSLRGFRRSSRRSSGAMMLDEDFGRIKIRGSRKRERCQHIHHYSMAAEIDDAPEVAGHQYHPHLCPPRLRRLR